MQTGLSSCGRRVYLAREVDSGEHNVTGVVIQNAAARVKSGQVCECCSRHLGGKLERAAHVLSFAAIESQQKGLLFQLQRAQLPRIPYVSAEVALQIRDGIMGEACVKRGKGDSRSGDVLTESVASTPQGGYSSNGKWF